MNMFKAKILLFGEYSLLLGSKGLALPLNQFQGHFATGSSIHIDESFNLKDFVSHLESSALLKSQFDLKRLHADLKKGLHFESTIPAGYGVGSSGALCAAFLKEYGLNPEKKSIEEIHDYLTLMENYYHGTSSGIDPLVSYLDSALLIHSRNEIEQLKNRASINLSNFFLVDSGISRNTSAFVMDFLRKVDSKEITADVKNDLIMNTNLLVEKFMVSDPIWTKYFKNISQFQSLYLSDMIPSALKPLWMKGLSSDDFWFKHCGAGGGGFVLVYSQNPVAFMETMGKKKIKYFALKD